MENYKKAKERIESMGIKKNHVAKRLGITDVMFSYYLNGKRNLSALKESELLKILQIKA